MVGGEKKGWVQQVKEVTISLVTLFTITYCFFWGGEGGKFNEETNEQNVRNAQAFNNLKSILLANIKLKDYLASHLFHSFLFLVKCQGQEEAPFHNVDHSSDRNK